jgi:hypothetical protein
MRIAVKYIFGQLLLLFCIASLCACSTKKDDAPVIPPLTSPLSGDYIGYGVITDSFTHITAEPSENSPSLGYLRRGSLVRITKRQTVRTGGAFVSWVQMESEQNGWLKEEVMDIYNSESQAKIASESVLK